MRLFRRTKLRKWSKLGRYQRGWSMTSQQPCSWLLRMLLWPTRSSYCTLMSRRRLQSTGSWLGLANCSTPPTSTWVIPWPLHTERFFSNMKRLVTVAARQKSLGFAWIITPARRRRTVEIHLLSLRQWLPPCKVASSTRYNICRRGSTTTPPATHRRAVSQGKKCQAVKSVTLAVPGYQEMLSEGFCSTSGMTGSCSPPCTADPRTCKLGKKSTASLRLIKVWGLFGHQASQPATLRTSSRSSSTSPFLWNVSWTRACQAPLSSPKRWRVSWWGTPSSWSSRWPLWSKERPISICGGLMSPTTKHLDYQPWWDKGLWSESPQTLRPAAKENPRLAMTSTAPWTSSWLWPCEQ